MIRLHGDCHPGNILWTPDQGARISSIWTMRASARRCRTCGCCCPATARSAASARRLVDGYEQFREFDRRELALIEPLRTLRLIHYSAWLARRWDDPIFPINFPGSAPATTGRARCRCWKNRSRRWPSRHWWCSEGAARGRFGEPGFARVSAPGSPAAPMPSISIRTTSPGFRNRGGLKPMPTPTGVPVAMMSPGFRVMPALIVSMIVGMSKIRSAVVAFCRSSPLTVAAHAGPGPSHLVGGDDPRAHRAEGVEALPRIPLLVACASRAR